MYVLSRASEGQTSLRILYSPIIIIQWRQYIRFFKEPVDHTLTLNLSQPLTSVREVIQLPRNAGTSSADPLHFVVHSDSLFPEATESSRDVVPEFPLDDFENTNVDFTGDILKQRFSPKRPAASASTANTPKDWTMRDLPDPSGHFRTVLNLYNVENVPVVVPNVCDAAGSLIHPTQYGKHFASSQPAVVEVEMRLWIFAPVSKCSTNTQIYQIILKSLRLLPLTGTPKAVLTKAVDPSSSPTEPSTPDNKAKRKVVAPAGQASPVKKRDSVK
ncbi:uncharacterized protein EDB91DRAFT_1077668 [Suillus paluster]|uniref:uncharacterized protein n=1 Tax=Suillus paluster TaxID=48578 RepID=UPI001B87EA00|nr:uncharacterized protein EDB91DRAFT_1077668 [Suillus paluster]KAG1754020.1 hypothetical protein EDB91DRAFT_1077668 [Suillus paluster]